MKNNKIVCILIVSMMFMPFFAMCQVTSPSTILNVDAKTKPSTSYKTYSTRIPEQLPGFKINKAIPVNIYGSRTDQKSKATGFFRTELIHGRWWIVDPEGYLNICRAVNDIQTGKGTISKNAFASKYDNNSETWMAKTMEYLNELGFYVAGSWSATSTITSNPRQLTKPLAYTIILNWMSGYGGNRTYQQSGHKGYPNNAIFVFEKGFAEYCDRKAKELVKNKEDKNLFGYFTDNELPFYEKSLNMFLRLGKSSPTDENYLATKKWLVENNYSEADTATTDVRLRFLGYVGGTYSTVVNAALKKYDPNHMNLGSRINVKEARNDPYFMQAFGKNVDILAVNYYGVWTPDSVSMRNWGMNLQKPFMVTEFYTKGEDSGLANTSGAGWIVKTQLERGYAYQNYTLALLESKYCVGWHWFKYMDNDPTTNAEPSNIDGNKGIVKTDYEPYLPLTIKMKEINLNVYKLVDYFDHKSSSK